MSIAEKIISIAENVPKVYEAGYGKGKSEGGGDNPLEYAVRVDNMFVNAIFPNEYELLLNIPVVTNITYIVSNATGLKKLTIKGNTNGVAVNGGHSFRGNLTLEVIDLSDFNAKFSSINYMFFDDRALKEVKGIIDLTECTSAGNAFSTCRELEEIRFKENSIKISISLASCSKLSAESVQSIIDGLATVETEQTLTLHSTVSSALTEEQWSEILNKNWMVQ